jgi:hypothetical protein
MVSNVQTYAHQKPALPPPPTINTEHMDARANGLLITKKTLNCMQSTMLYRIVLGLAA